MLSVYRRAVKLRWPQSYKQKMVHGDGRWLVVRDVRQRAHERGYGGFVWTSIWLCATENEARQHASAGLVMDCETLTTFRRAVREQQGLNK